MKQLKSVDLILQEMDLLDLGGKPAVQLSDCLYKAERILKGEAQYSEIECVRSFWITDLVVLVYRKNGKCTFYYLRAGIRYRENNTGAREASYKLKHLASVIGLVENLPITRPRHEVAAVKKCFETLDGKPLGSR